MQRFLPTRSHLFLSSNICGVQIRLIERAKDFQHIIHVSAGTNMASHTIVYYHMNCLPHAQCTLSYIVGINHCVKAKCYSIPSWQKKKHE